MSNDHNWTEYAAPYALGVLDEQERVEFEAHLSECSACRAEVQSFQEVTGTLAAAAPARTAPPQLKQRILTDARKVRPITSAGPVVVPARKPSIWPALLAAASLAISAGLAFIYTRERSARLIAENDAQQAQAQLVTAQAQVARSDSLLSALLAPDVQTAALAAQGRPPSARLYYNRAQRVMVLTARDLPQASSGRTYQVWGIAANAQPVSLGVFNTGSDGSAVITMPIPEGARFDVSAVTEEPAGGSAQPTTQPFLVGNWSGL